jgi:hypothetical protein
VTGSYQVDTGELANLARSVANLSDDLRAALDAVSQATMPGDAYGQVGGPVAQMLGQLSGAGRDALQSGVDALDWVGTTLTGNASEYDSQEQTQAAAFADLDGDLV